MIARRARFTALALVVTASCLGGRAEAGGSRPSFEPTDMELEDAGVLEIDTQLGLFRGEGPWRFVVPDVELDLGLARNVELDLDWSYAFEGPDGGRLAVERAAPDHLWLATKIGVLDVRDTTLGTAWAFGVQFGPKAPVAREARGAGFEGLVLLGRTIRATHLVLNAGALVDPGAEVSRRRPAGFEGGLDLAYGLDPKGTFSLTGELGGVHFVSVDRDQLHGTAGLAWEVVEDALDVSFTGLVGFLPGGDRYGGLVGISPKFRLWR